jgi:hypothetical protein
LAPKAEVSRQGSEGDTQFEDKGDFGFCRNFD